MILHSQVSGWTVNVVDEHQYILRSYHDTHMYHMSQESKNTECPKKNLPLANFWVFKHGMGVFLGKK